jgi:nucleotide-binding universal stress UspA family protein
MSYRTLLVHLDDHARCAERVDLAVRLAGRFQAHLAGLAAIGTPPMDGGPGMLGVDVLTTALAALRSAADARVQRFRSQCAQRGLHSVEALVDGQDDADAIVQRSGCTDLAIIGQADPDRPHYRDARAAVEHVVLHNPRPTLVVPYAGRFTDAGDIVLVAWDDSRACARAVADAMPVLRQAAKVHLLHRETALAVEDGLVQDRLDAVHQWLMWHGVKADVHVEPSEVDAGNALLSRAADLGADMIVMGAYGRAR